VILKFSGLVFILFYILFHVASLHNEKCFFFTLQNGHILESANVNTESENEKKSNLGFIHAFIASLSVIIVSELGDKTFFIAAIMAMRHPRLTVFLGAITALGLMTILSGKFPYNI
jgi:hypothetical protein